MAHLFALPDEEDDEPMSGRASEVLQLIESERAPWLAGQIDEIARLLGAEIKALHTETAGLRHDLSEWRAESAARAAQDREERRAAEARQQARWMQFVLLLSAAMLALVGNLAVWIAG
jgi:hypothetical protein